MSAQRLETFLLLKKSLQTRNECNKREVDITLQRTRWWRQTEEQEQVGDDKAE